MVATLILMWPWQFQSEVLHCWESPCSGCCACAFSPNRCRGTPTSTTSYMEWTLRSKPLSILSVANRRRATTMIRSLAMQRTWSRCKLCEVCSRCGSCAMRKKMVEEMKGGMIEKTQLKKREGAHESLMCIHRYQKQVYQSSNHEQLHCIFIDAHFVSTNRKLALIPCPWMCDNRKWNASKYTWLFAVITSVNICISRIGQQ